VTGETAMDIYPITINQQVFIGPEIYEGLYFSFRKLSELLAIGGGLAAPVFLLEAIGRRHISVAERKVVEERKGDER
jgi:hypothetical protein